MKKTYLPPKVAQKFKNFTHCKKGNFALLTAILSPVVLVSGSLALDVANMTALKGSLQSASDSVSLTIATRIANGALSVDDAESFGNSLLLAQMSNVEQRFINLVVTPSISVVENNSASGQKSWNVEIGGSASQDTTPLATFLGKSQMTVSTTSTATTATEEEVGASPWQWLLMYLVR